MFLETFEARLAYVVAPVFILGVAVLLLQIREIRRRSFEEYRKKLFRTSGEGWCRLDGQKCTIKTEVMGPCCCGHFVKGEEDGREEN